MEFPLLQIKSPPEIDKRIEINNSCFFKKASVKEKNDKDNKKNWVSNINKFNEIVDLNPAEKGNAASKNAITKFFSKLS
tara:strand:+ start:417 stop:653 length:237 start_codon:yes stop_codon:yes gene_type:complete